MPATNPGADVDRFQRRCAWVILAAAAVFFLATRARVLPVPFERDEGEYAYIAQGLRLGEAPYRDAFLQKTPGVVLIYAAVFAVFGESIAAVHAVAYGVTALTAAMLFVLVKQLADLAAAALAALIFVVVSIEPQLLATSANTEHFGLCAVTACVLAALYARQTGRLRWWLAAGMAFAASVACKQVAVAPAATAILCAVIPGLRKGFRVQGSGFGEVGTRARRRRAGPEGTKGSGIGDQGSGIGIEAPAGAGAFVAALRGVGGFMAGLALVLVPLAVYLIRSGVWNDFVDCAIIHNLEYGRRVPLSKGWEGLTFALGNQWPVFAVTWSLAMLGILRSFLARGNGRAEAARLLAIGPGVGGEGVSASEAPIIGRGIGWFWLAWLGLSFVAICAALNFYEHYFVWWLAPLAGAGGIGGAWLLQGARRVATPAGAGMAGLLAVALAAPTLAFNRNVWFAHNAGRMAAELYGANVFAESPAMADLIRDGSAPDDRVLILGTEPQIIFYAGRRSVTRYIIMYPLFGPYPDARERQHEVMTAVAATPPRWIVDVRLPNSRTPHPDHPVDLERFVAALLLVGEGYTLEALAEPKWKERRFELLAGDEARARVDRVGAPEACVLMYRRD